MDWWRGLSVAILCIASLLMVLLLIEVRWYKNDLSRMETHISEIDHSTDRRLFNWSEFLEKRVNRLAQTQDEYEVGISKRIDILEKRLEKIEKTHNNKNP